MIDALFGSKTRVKLLHLFLNNPDKAFYVREITRLIDEQINSVRRELANMMKVGIVLSNSVDNKLYYEANQKYEHYLPLKQIFGDNTSKRQDKTIKGHDVWRDELMRLPGLRLAVAAGALVRGSASQIDLLLVGDVQVAKVKSLIKSIEKSESREVNYSVLAYEDFYYRLSVRDRFVNEVVGGTCSILVDTDNILSHKGGDA